MITFAILAGAVFLFLVAPIVEIVVRVTLARTRWYQSQIPRATPAPRLLPASIGRGHAVSKAGDESLLRSRVT